MKSIIIYGTGKYFEENRDKLPGDAEIVAYCDSDEKKATSVSNQLFLGKEMLAPQELENRSFDNIWICIFDWNICWEVFSGLKKYNIDLRKVKFLNRVDYESNGLTYYIDEDKNLISQWGNIKVKEKRSDADPAETFLYDEYNLKLPSAEEKPAVLIDIGMNLGYTSLYFAEKDYVKKVYGYEPFIDTFKDAEENFALNSKEISSKINSHHQAVLDYSGECEVEVTTEIRGHRSILKCCGEGRKETVQVVEARTEFAKIIQANPNMRIILLVDTEGSEFKIFENLSGKGILGNIDIIMMEYHADPTRIEEIMREEGFIIFRTGFYGRVDHSFGLIFAVNRNI